MAIIQTARFFSKKGDEVIIRTAEVKDAEAVLEIDKSVLDEKIYTLREPWESINNTDKVRKDIEEHIAEPESLYLVAETENTVAGFLEFKNGSLSRTAHAGMFQMFILKDFRNSGIGKMLLDALIKWAQNNPVIEKLTLNVFSTNQRAIHLYSGLGFKEEGRCPKDMKLSDGTYIDSVLMYLFVK